MSTSVRSTRPVVLAALFVVAAFCFALMASTTQRTAEARPPGASAAGARSTTTDTFPPPPPPAPHPTRVKVSPIRLQPQADCDAFVHLVGWARSGVQDRRFSEVPPAEREHYNSAAFNSFDVIVDRTPRSPSPTGPVNPGFIATEEHAIRTLDGDYSGGFAIALEDKNGFRSRIEGRFTEADTYSGELRIESSTCTVDWSFEVTEVSQLVRRPGAPISPGRLGVNRSQ